MLIPALLSGIVSGAAVGVLGLGILGPLVVTVPNTNRLRTAYPDPSNWVMVSLAAAFAAQIGCVVLGLVFGAGFYGTQDEFGSGLGSPNWLYTAAVLIGAALATATMVAFMPSRWRRMALLGAIVAGAYGWMLPHLAASAG